MNLGIHPGVNATRIGWGGFRAAYYFFDSGVLVVSPAAGVVVPALPCTLPEVEGERAFFFLHSSAVCPEPPQNMQRPAFARRSRSSGFNFPSLPSLSAYAFGFFAESSLAPEVLLLEDFFFLPEFALSFFEVPDAGGVALDCPVLELLEEW